MTILDVDVEKAKAFCDSIGCTEVHHLRDQLPGFVAAIREEERARCVRIILTDNSIEVSNPPDHMLLVIAEKAATGVHAIVELMRGAVKVNRAVLVHQIVEEG